jgi:uncharacterized protein YacL (UPF0231 family)
VIDPEDSNRKIPLLELASDQEIHGPSVIYQKLGDTVLLELSSICQSYDLGFRLQFLPRQQKFVFRIYRSKDRSLDQTENAPVLFSSALDDILESSYQHNKSDLRNVAYIAGEGTGNDRKVQRVGDSSGLNRRELFVDARDLQSTNEDGTSISDEDYYAMLAERGNTKLEDYKEVKSFSATLRTFGITGYTYGVDFMLGDTVTVYDSKLRIRVNAVVTAAMKTYDEDGERLDLTFGYEQPTLATKLRRMM